MLIGALAFGIVVAAVWAVGIAADAMVGRRLRLPERWAAHIPGHLPAYARAQLRKARTPKE